MKAVGAFSVKSYNQPRRDQRQQVIAAARELDMMVVPEGGSLFEHNMTQVVDGHTGVEHSIPVARAYDDVRQLWKGTQVGYTPTLIVAYGGIWGENYWYDKTRVWENDRLMPLRAARGARRALAPPGHRAGRGVQPLQRRPHRRRAGARRASRCSSAPTASARGSAPTGRCGCSRRAA